MIKVKDDKQNEQSDLRKFLTFTIANPKVPLIIWFWGILIKSLTIMWLVYCCCRGIMILVDQGPPEAFLMILLQTTAATILYFLGDGLCHGERSALSIFLVFIPPLVSGFRNLRLLD